MQKYWHRRLLEGGPGMPLSRYQGRFDPVDLEMMRRVFDTVCNERRIALKDKEQRNDLAAEIVTAFDHGATNEEELLKAVSRRRRR
jgi:hypothetical protein